MQREILQEAPLGKKTDYITQYQSDLLFPIPRKPQRSAIGLQNSLPFQGQDIWNAFELSWLNTKGKPIVAVAEFHFDCVAENIVESKSLKLYLHSFNNTKFDSFAEVEQILIRDLSYVSGAPVIAKLFPINQAPEKKLQHFNGICLDELDIACDTYAIQPTFLSAGHEVVTETLYSDLLKSNCFVTGQPDWASVKIAYTGKKINREGLLKYIVSFRNHQEFHEHCVERMFVDITQYCAPEKLFVYARYTRRGGLDINVYRTNYAIEEIDNVRLWRQ